MSPGVGGRWPPQTEVEDPPDTITLNRVPSGRSRSWRPNGGADRLFDFVLENLTARLVDAARRCTEAATTGQPDQTPTAGRSRSRRLGA